MKIIHGNQPRLFNDPPFSLEYFRSRVYDATKDFLMNSSSISNHMRLRFDFSVYPDRKFTFLQHLSADDLIFNNIEELVQFHTSQFLLHRLANIIKIPTTETDAAAIGEYKREFDIFLTQNYAEYEAMGIKPIQCYQLNMNSSECSMFICCYQNGNSITTQHIFYFVDVVEPVLPTYLISLPKDLSFSPFLHYMSQLTCVLPPYISQKKGPRHNWSVKGSPVPSEITFPPSSLSQQKAGPSALDLSDVPNTSDHQILNQRSPTDTDISFF